MYEEEIKKILCDFVNDIEAECKITITAKAICQLFEPKPDESRLPTKNSPNHLTPEEKVRAFEDYPCLDPSFEDDYASEVATLLDAQDAKTASYHQAQLKEIKNQMEQIIRKIL